ncbi:MAG: NAD-dependent epimerase/dehydratase family protein [Desulfuromonadaceae bacterium]
MSFFITGATGFVGSSLIKRLQQNNIRLTAAVLSGENSEHLPTAVDRVTVEPLSESSDYTSVLQNIDIVIHLAARVHVMQETATDPLLEFRKVNLHGTEQLARQAAKAGVKRFVFMSTIGVNGDNSGDRPYTEGDVPHPHNPYSVSKYEAELALRQISIETGMEIVIIRAPLVYGPGNPGNFLSLLRIISKRNFEFWILNFGLKSGIPLPFASINNRRSLIYVGNLVDALATCATHPAAAGKTYLVSDGEDVSTAELVRRVARALEVPARLLPLPVSVMKFCARLLDNFGFLILNFVFKSKTDNSKSRIQNSKFTGAVNRLTGSLTVDSAKIGQELGWKPPFTMEEGLGETAAWYKKKF